MTATTNGNTGQDVQSPLTLGDLRLQLAALNALKKRVAAAEADVRDRLHAEMTDGESHTVWSPLDGDAQIATVNRSKPTAKASVTDRAALEAWLTERYPEKLDRRRRATEEGIAFLADVSPALVEEVTSVPAWAVEEVVKASAKAKEPCTPDGTLNVPGVQVDRRPEGSLSVRLSDEAADLVADLIASGRLDTDGRPKEIER